MEDGADRAGQDLQVQQQRLVLDVPEVELDPLAPGEGGAALDLLILWRTARMVLGGDGLYRGEAPAWRDPPSDS